MITTDLLSTLTELDTNVFLFFNGFHAPFWDTFMRTFTRTLIWAPMYATLLYVLLKNYPWKTVVCYVIAIALTITLADQICSSLIRPAVARLRPANLESPILNLVHIVNDYRGGRYGFPSCHAANSFALVSFVLFTFRNRRLTLFFLAWASLNCYTRIYLGVHYPGDLLVGALIGSCLGGMLSMAGSKAAARLDNAMPQSTPITSTAIPMMAGSITLLGIILYSFIQS